MSSIIFNAQKFFPHNAALCGRMGENALSRPVWRRLVPAAQVSDSAGSRSMAFFAAESMSLILLSWFTSLAPGS